MLIQHDHQRNLIIERVPEGGNLRTHPPVPGTIVRYHHLAPSEIDDFISPAVGLVVWNDGLDAVGILWSGDPYSSQRNG